jgi:hypothetical protein
MTNSVGSTKRLSLQVRDQAGMRYTVDLTVAEQDKTGALVVLTTDGRVVEKFGLTNLKKSADGKRLTCQVSGAAVTLSLEDDGDPPTLQVVARYVVSFFEAAYRLCPTERQRCVEWIRELEIGVQA